MSSTNSFFVARSFPRSLWRSVPCRYSPSASPLPPHPRSPRRRSPPLSSRFSRCSLPQARTILPLFFSTLLLLLSDSRLPSFSIKRSLGLIVPLGSCAPLPRSLSPSVGFSLSFHPRLSSASLPLSCSSSVCRVLFPTPRSFLVTPFSRRPLRFPAILLRPSRRSLFSLLESVCARARPHSSGSIS